MGDFSSGLAYTLVCWHGYRAKVECSIRICVDLKPRIASIQREVHPLPIVDDTLAQLTGAKMFSKLWILANSIHFHHIS